MEPYSILAFLPGLQMGQGLWRVARNQQLQQEGYGEQGYLSREQSRRVAANTMSHTSHRKHVQGGIDIEKQEPVTIHLWIK